MATTFNGGISHLFPSIDGTKGRMDPGTKSVSSEAWNPDTSETEAIINQLYEDKVANRLSPERFARMLAQFETEQEGLRSKCEALRAEITAARTTSDKAKQFIRVVKRFTEMQELTPEIVATLIERVEIGQAQVVDGEKKQEIKIVYNFVGDIRE